MRLPCQIPLSSTLDTGKRYGQVRMLRLSLPGYRTQERLRLFDELERRAPFRESSPAQRFSPGPSELPPQIRECPQLIRRLSLPRKTCPACDHTARPSESDF